MEQFTAPLAPLIDAEKFACVLAQFPYSFHAWTRKPPLTLVYMNNHWQGQVAGTARQLRMLMGGEGNSSS